MDLYYLAGEKFNWVGRGPNALSSSGTVDSNFPLTNLGVYRPREPFSFSQSVADMRAIVDTCLVADSSIEGTLDDNWTDASSGGGAATQDATPSTGTYSLKLVPGASGVASRYQDLIVRSGERFTIRASFQAPGGGTVAVRIYNPQTGLYLDSTGAWIAAPATDADHAISKSTNTSSLFETESLAFQVESRSDCGDQDLVLLRVQPYSADNITTYVDDIELIPAINFLGVFSHNFDPILTPTWRSDDDSAFGSATTRATPTIARPNFYSVLGSAFYERYQDLKLAGGPQGADAAGGNNYPRAGELVIGYAETIARMPDPQWTDRYDKQQSRVVTPERDQHIASRGSHRLRTLNLPFTHFSLSDRNEIRDEILARGGYGERPSVIVPASTEPDVLFCRAGASWEVKRRHIVWAGDTLVLEEDPHMEWIDG